MSPFSPSFPQPLGVHRATDGIFAPLFSITSELLFSQLLCFHIYLRCPPLFAANLNFFKCAAPLQRPVHATRLLSEVCALLFSLASLFRIRFLCFQSLAASFRKTPGVWSTRGISCGTLSLLDFKTGGRTNRRCRRRRLRQALAVRHQGGEAGRGSLLCRASGAGRWRLRRTAR